MPKLVNLIGRSGELRIPVPNDDDLVVKYNRPRFTPDVLTQIASFQELKGFSPEAVNLIYDLSSRVIASWNLEDEDGPIPTTAEAMRERVDIMVLMELVQRIAETFRPDPTKGEDSDAG